MLNYNRRGQMLLVGILVLVMAILVFISTLPAIQDVMDDSRSCNSMNCEGYVDSDATGASGGNCSVTNRSYNKNLSQNSLSCTIMDLFVPFLILGILIGIITKLLHGGLVDPPQPQYSYPGQY